jgi:hypothetical protein
MKCGISAPIKMMFLHLIIDPLIDITIYNSTIKHLLSNSYVKVLKSLPGPFHVTGYYSEELFSGTGFVVCYKIVIYEFVEYEREHDRLPNESAQAVHG